MRTLFSIFSMLLSASAYANFVVHTGETATTTQILTNPGDVGLIEEGGAITAINTGVTSLAPLQTVLNKGTIVTIGAGQAIQCGASSVGSTIVNQGILLTQGASGNGFTNMGTRNTFINNGLISTLGATSLGVNSIGNGAILTNNGMIQTLGANSIGIRSVGSNSIISNNGTLLTRGDLADGMLISGNNHIVNNSGKITTFGNASHGISASTSASIFFNQGFISVNGPGASGFIASGNGEHLVNSGIIRSAQSFALSFPGLNPTLTLLKGSKLQGPVQSTLLNLNVETGLNLALSLSAGSPGFASLGIDAPFVVVGNTIVVIDPTGLGLQADVLADLSDTILGGVYRHRTGFTCCKNRCERGLWVEGLGSYRDRNRNHDNVGYHNWQGGFIVGYDMPAWCGDIDFFGGATFGKAIVDQRTQEADLSNYFGGASYERILCNNFFGAALVAGYSRLSNDRYVMYNLAPGGVQTAHATPDGFFVAPELTYARQFNCRWFSPILSGTVRYAGLFLGSYNEHGSIADLSVHHRKVQLVTTQAQLGLPFGKSACDRCWNAEPYLGVAGRFQVSGKDVDATLLGQDIRFNAGNNQNLGYFLVGFRGRQSLGCLSLFLNVEADFDNHHSSRVLGEGGIGFNF